MMAYNNIHRLVKYWGSEEEIVTLLEAEEITAGETRQRFSVQA